MSSKKKRKAIRKRYEFGDLSNNKPERYNVVFETTSGVYRGIRTWTSYQSKEEFKNRFSKLMIDKKVIGEGLSDDESIQLCKETKTEDRLRTALYNSVTSEGIDRGLLELELDNLRFIARL